MNLAVGADFVRPYSEYFSFIQLQSESWLCIIYVVIEAQRYLR